jgi:hypothetical protein
MSAYYPDEFARVENKLIHARRQSGAKMEKGEAAATRPAHVVGLALSGGGIRSATFCLGVLQALAGKSLLRKIDLLSTVSGGGYIGSFLGAWITRQRATGGKVGVAEVEAGLKNLESPEIRFLRENGRFIAPNGAGDGWAAAVIHVRNWLSMLVVIGTLVLGGFMLTEALKLGLNASGLGWGKATAWTFGPEAAAHGNAAAAAPNVETSALADITIWFSPYWRFVKWAVLLGALPPALAYWLVFPITGRPSWAFFLPPVALAGLCSALHFDSTLLPTFIGKQPWFWCTILLLSIEWCLWADYKQRRGLANGKSDSWGRWVSLFLFVYAAGMIAWIGLICAQSQDSADPWPQRWLFLILAIGAWHLLAGAAALAHREKDEPEQAAGAPAEGTTPDSAASGSPNQTRPKTSAKSRAIQNMAGLLLSEADFDAARSGLTKWLARASLAAVLLLALVVIDSIAQTVAALQGSNIAKWTWTILSPAAVVTFMQTIAPRLFARDEEPEESSGLGLTIALWAAAGVFLLVSVVGVATSARLWAFHLAGSDFWTWAAFGRVALWAAVLFIASSIIGHRLQFVNLSSHHQLYSARLTRAYLGASNPKRKANVNGLMTETVPGDQIEYADYKPHESGGPLHLINVTINETVSGISNVEQRDRKGLSFALGPAGLSVRRVDHALFADHAAVKARQAALKPIGANGRFHVFGKGNDPENTPISVEMPPLGAWVGISGAAFTTGLGARTDLAKSLLLGLLNVRLGHWWDSGVEPSQRQGAARQSMSGMVGKWIAGWFPAQVAFGDELLARFHGPARRHWYLSDGGHFENTGCYELIRRRVPFIIACDCGADPKYQFEDVATLVRKARIDFGTKIDFFEEPQVKANFPDGEGIIGALSDLIPRQDADNNQKLSRAHAAVAELTYPALPGGAEEKGWLLLIKPTLTEEMSRDILHYAIDNDPFPQQSTMDQFFDEAQWESYRRLGSEVGDKVFEYVKSYASPAGTAGDGWDPGFGRPRGGPAQPTKSDQSEVVDQLIELFVRIREQYRAPK